MVRLKVRDSRPENEERLMDIAILLKLIVLLDQEGDQQLWTKADHTRLAKRFS